MSQRLQFISLQVVELLHQKRAKGLIIFCAPLHLAFVRRKNNMYLHAGIAYDCIDAE